MGSRVAVELGNWGATGQENIELGSREEVEQGRSGAGEKEC